MDSRINTIYGRQSIDKKDSISIEIQFEFCRYELKGGEGREYKNKGFSGKNIERQDFQPLLQNIKLGLISRVIVYKLERISCSIVNFAKRMELFKQYKVEFVSCTEQFDTTTPTGRTILNILYRIYPTRTEMHLSAHRTYFLFVASKATIYGVGRHTVLIPSPSSWTGSRHRSWWKMRKWILLS